MDPLVFYVIFMVIELIIVTLHSCGIYFLNRLRSNAITNAQQIFVLNMSVIAIIVNIFYFNMHLNEMFLYHGLKVPPYEAALEHVSVFMRTSIRYAFYSLMTYVATDKLLTVWLDMNYTVYCNTRNARHLALLTWVIGVVLCVCIFIGKESFGFEYADPMQCLIVIYNVVFICVTVTSFVYISYYSWLSHVQKLKENFDSHKEKKKKRREKEEKKKQQQQKLELQEPQQRQQRISFLRLQAMLTSNSRYGLLLAFKDSRFYISSALILNFLCFTAIPDLLLAFRDDDLMKYRTLRDVILSFCYHITFLGIILIYVYLYEPMKKIVKKSIKDICKKKEKPTSQEVTPEPLLEAGDGENPNLQFITTI